jgi:hypothetical protein
MECNKGETPELGRDALLVKRQHATFKRRLSLPGRNRPGIESMLEPVEQLGEFG